MIVVVGLIVYDRHPKTYPYLRSQIRQNSRFRRFLCLCPAVARHATLEVAAMSCRVFFALPPMAGADPGWEPTSDLVDEQNLGSQFSPQLPERSQRMAATFVPAPHPALLSGDELLSQCDFRAQRRSGPGGQHRNKTSSGVFLHHPPSGVSSEATERRSQAMNRVIAPSRLRYRLAIELRTASPIDPSVDRRIDPSEHQLRNRYQGKSLRISDTNEAKPGVLALLLNDLHASGGQPSLVAPLWLATTSAIVAIVKSNPAAFTLLNAIRHHHGRRPLK